MKKAFFVLAAAALLPIAACAPNNIGVVVSSSDPTIETVVLFAEPEGAVDSRTRQWVSGGLGECTLSNTEEDEACLQAFFYFHSEDYPVMIGGYVSREGEGEESVDICEDEEVEIDFIDVDVVVLEEGDDLFCLSVE